MNRGAFSKVETGILILGKSGKEYSIKKTFAQFIPIGYAQWEKSISKQVFTVFVFVSLANSSWLEY